MAFIATQRTENTRRYAIYYVPEESSAVYRAGVCWLGRDAATGATHEPALGSEVSMVMWQSATESPRRYGFHATLKPPFRLACGATLHDLQTALRTRAARWRSFAAPGFVLGTLGRFLALVLTEPSAAFCALAANCMRDLDEFRSPASAEELALRTHDKLTQCELENLERWGYPYVLDTWKFHISLTCSLEFETRKVCEAHLAQLFAEPCKESSEVKSICLFEEPEPGAEFRLVERIALARP